MPRVDWRLGGAGGLAERFFTIEKAGSPTASPIITIRGMIFLEDICAALRV
jgi:hypothetical protein